jgi:hypothetical protein
VLGFGAAFAQKPLQVYDAMAITRRLVLLEMPENVLSSCISEVPVSCSFPHSLLFSAHHSGLH